MNSIEINRRKVNSSDNRVEKYRFIASSVQVNSSTIIHLKFEKLEKNFFISHFAGVPDPHRDEKKKNTVIGDL